MIGSKNSSYLDFMLRWRDLLNETSRRDDSVMTMLTPLGPVCTGTVLAEAETRATEEVGATTEEESSYRFYDYDEKQTLTTGLAQRMQPFYRFAPLGLFQILSILQSMTRIIVGGWISMTTMLLQYMLPPFVTRWLSNIATSRSI